MNYSLSTYSIISGILLFTATQPLNAAAVSFSYNDFSDPSGLQINGDAGTALDDANRHVLRLTSVPLLGRAGSAFSTNMVSLNSITSFSSAFQFRMYDVQGDEDDDGLGADGLTFIVQTESNTVGFQGHNIGYAPTLTNSLVIEFDTWNNFDFPNINDIDGNHVGINLNGDPESVLASSITNRMNNGSIWSAWVDYDGPTNDLEVRLLEGENAIRPAAALLIYNVDLLTVLGSTDAFFGFTAATGGSVENHDILNWQFQASDAIEQSTVPIPAAFWLFGTGLIGLFCCRKKINS